MVGVRAHGVRDCKGSSYNFIFKVVFPVPAAHVTIYESVNALTVLYPTQASLLHLGPYSLSDEHSTLM